MSNEVYGLIESHQVINWNDILTSIQDKTGIGIKLISKTELYNFPEELISTSDCSNIAFIVGDKPGKTNTTYLTDYQDYAPETDFGLPYKAKARLGLLVDMFYETIKQTKARRFVVAITDSSQIDEVKVVALSELSSLIFSDFEKYDMPDCIYDVVITNNNELI